MNPYWNPKITTESGLMRQTIGVVRELPMDVTPRRAVVDVCALEGDGSKTEAAVLAIADGLLERIDIGQTVMVLFFGATPDSGVVLDSVTLL